MGPSEARGQWYLTRKDSQVEGELSHFQAAPNVVGTLNHAGPVDESR